MMAEFRIRTKRLDLVPATIQLLVSERDDTETFARLLDAVVPGSWPPPLVDAETLGEFIRITSEKADPSFFSWYWIRDDPSAGGRVLIGCGGSASSAASPDTACIGYSVLEEYQNQGYATEAVRHLIPVLFSLPGIRQVMATTYPYLAASIRVLEKNGFVYAGENHNGEGIEEGTGVYLLKKPDEADKN
jgi:RimJ/RimL family protein N-acetyltransferase